MSIVVNQIDHIVITVKDVETSLNFYRDVLGMQQIELDNQRKALGFGSQKINLHPANNSITPRAATPMPGSTDICLVSQLAPEQVVTELLRHGIAIEAGPVTRQGALGNMRSVYFRDPDGNLIEIAHYEKK